jgi:CRP-like cAMP-binding protein
MAKSRRTPAQSPRSPDSPAAQSRNKLLAALPASEYRRLRPLLTETALKPRQVLHESGDRIQSVYFPLEGLCSMVTTMEDGRMVEVATVGNEGMTGVSAIFGGHQLSGDIIVQMAGTSAEAMSLDVFSAEMGRRGPLCEIVSRYASVLLAFVMQSAACNGLHAADERCARWLLHTRDRMGEDSFPLTQEFLAVMLGVRRATITVIAHELQRAGLVEFERRHVTILDRSGLEATACECYRVIKDQFDRLLS